MPDTRWDSTGGPEPQFDRLLRAIPEEVAVTYCQACDKFFNSHVWACPFFECKGDPIKGTWTPKRDPS